MTFFTIRAILCTRRHVAMCSIITRTHGGVDAATGQALFYYCRQVSGLCAQRELLLQHYCARVERVERDGYARSMGYEPGSHKRPRGVDDYESEAWWGEHPNVDIRHDSNWTRSRWSQDQFRDKKTCQGWKMADEIPYWGVTKGRFSKFLSEAVLSR